jgi:AcrR family transcriptional regulator
MGETMKKENRSVRRTKKALHDSLVELLKTRSILRIGVKEICDGADVGRSTFYAHYDDQYDLLREMEDEAFDGFEALRREQIETITKRPGAQDFKRLVEGMLDYIVKNGASIQVLLSENGDQNFSKRFFRVSTDRLHDFHKRTSAQAAGDEKIAHYHAVFVTGGFITLIQEWLKSGMDTPVPEMANLLANLTRAALE